MGTRKKRTLFDDTSFAPKAKKAPPFDFVLDELAPVAPYTRPMFGCTAVYVDERIVFVLRDKAGQVDNGVWVATTKEHHAALRKDLPILRSISIFGPGETGWQNLPSDEPAFEENVLRACALVVASDPRIGKIPVSRKRPVARRAAPKKKTATRSRRASPKR